MHQITTAEVVGALRKCIDPELSANVIDIGLIYGINIDEKNNIKVTLTMTAPTCPVISIILADIELRLKEIPDVGEVDLELVWDPMWNPDMMSDSLKQQYQALI